MTHFSQRRGAFTLVEVLVASALSSVVLAGLAAFSFSSSRLAARNFALNHGHGETRLGMQRLLRDLQSATSPFQLLRNDAGTAGAFLAQAEPPSSGNTNPFLAPPVTESKYSVRWQGVQFHQEVGGPLRITSNATPASTTLTFSRPAGSTYAPRVGDKLAISIFGISLDINAVLTLPAATGDSSFTVQIPRLDFTLETMDVLVVTATFHRRVAYAVLQEELRFYPAFSPSTPGPWSVIARDFTCPAPFAQPIIPGESRAGNPTPAALDKTKVCVFLENSDRAYRERRFAASTTVIQTITNSRTLPIVKNFAP